MNDVLYINYLEQIGFGKYESKVLNCLIKASKFLSAKECSLNTNVPYGKVYEVLQYLQLKKVIIVLEKGEHTIVKRKSFKALPLKEIIEIMRLEHDKNFNEAIKYFKEIGELNE